MGTPQFTPEVAALLDSLDRFTAIAAHYGGGKPEWLEEWQLRRACPPDCQPPGQVLIVAGGQRVIYPDGTVSQVAYVFTSRQVLRDLRAHPESSGPVQTLAMLADAMKATGIHLWRRKDHPEQCPSPVFHAAYVAHQGRLQKISYSALPVVPSVAPRTPARPSRLPAWLEWARPAVAAIIGVPLALASSSGSWRSPATGPLAS